MSTTALTSVSNNKASKKKVSVIAFDDIPPAEEEHDSAADDEGVEVPPHFAEEAPPRRLNSELDPALVIAATIFVEELVKTAEEEVQSRFNQEGRPHESQPLLGKTAGKCSRRRLRGDDRETSQDKHIRFIREEINKKCRRVYQAFLSCYGKLP